MNTNCFVIITVIFTLSDRVGGGGVGVPMQISTIENFLDIYGTATRFGGFSPNLLENKILEKF